MLSSHRNHKSSLQGNLIQLSCQVGRCLLVMALLVGILGCVSRRYGDYPAYSPLKIRDHSNYGVGRFKSVFLVNQIEQYYRGSSAGPIGVTTFVNVDDLYSTSTFGRIYAEQVMSELAMRGFDVIELRHSEALQFLESAGEFALSRDVGMVRRMRDLGGIVVGTYAASPIRVYVNARIIDPSTSRVVAVGSVEMERSQEIARLLRGGSFPATLERIPVKHLGLSTYPMGLSPYAHSRMWEAEELGMNARQPVSPQFPVLPPSGQ